MYLVLCIVFLEKTPKCLKHISRCGRRTLSQNGARKGRQTSQEKPSGGKTFLQSGSTSRDVLKALGTLHRVSRENTKAPQAHLEMWSTYLSENGARKGRQTSQEKPLGGEIFLKSGSTSQDVFEELP